MASTGRVAIYKPEEHVKLLPEIVEIHIACIEVDHQLLTFLPPFNRPEMQEWWDQFTRSPQRITFMVFDRETPASDEELAGFVALYMPESQTGPFRAEVQKLCVSTRFRRRGIARTLMTALEETAQRLSRGLLTLDTETGCPAELVYPKLGYTEMGRIPNSGISPKDGRLTSETFFYKDLRELK